MTSCGSINYTVCQTYRSIATAIRKPCLPFFPMKIVEAVLIDTLLYFLLNSLQTKMADDIANTVNLILFLAGCILLKWENVHVKVSFSIPKRINSLISRSNMI